ncbi:hypothetical protein HMI55_005664, partial [Coelomomyces lativittatus]
MKRLEETYGPKFEDFLARQKISKLRQKGKLESFVEEFLELAACTTMEDADLQVAFVNGLKENIFKEIARFLPCENLQELLQYVRSTVLKNEVMRQSMGIPMQVDAIEGKEKAQFKNTFKCYSCGENGHMKRNCPKTKKRKAQISAIKEAYILDVNAIQACVSSSETEKEIPSCNEGNV